MFIYIYIYIYIYREREREREHKNSQREALNMHIPLKTITKVTVSFYTKLTDFRKRIESSQASTARPSGNGQHIHEDECAAMVELY